MSNFRREGMADMLPSRDGPMTASFQPAASAFAEPVRYKRSLADHWLGIGMLSAVTLWTTGRFVFTSGIPAGTDMLGFISRAAQYASPGRFVDAWSPDSFGARRTFNFDNILGALTVVTRDPVLTVKLLAMLTMFATGLTAYALAWSWYRHRVVATASSLLYLASQAALTRWGSGQLNVEIIIALYPLMILAWSSCLERFTLSRAAGFAATMGVSFLVRADLVLYVVPFLVLYAAVVLTGRGRLRAVLANAARTLAVAVPGVFMLNAAWLVPLVAGYQAQYQTSGQLFSVSELASRSIGFYPSVLGFGREIGYFDFTGGQTWYSYPGLPLWAYYAFATSVPLLAVAALWWHRDHRTIFLASAAVFATFVAPGISGPLGSAYLWAAVHIPVFGNLRDPNRWLIGQAVGYALLASLTIERVSAAVSGAVRRRLSLGNSRRTRAAIAGATSLSLLAVALVPVGPTLTEGLRTWQVTASQQALFGLVRRAPGVGRVATVPFDQDYRFLVQGSYRGYEHDLGSESALFTSRSAVGDGSWNQRSANFVAYAATLLARRDPAFPAMLGSVGVGRVVSLSYPLTASSLVREVGAYGQQKAVAGLPGLTPMLSNSAGTDFAVRTASAPLSFRRDIAVVLGGSEGTAALADQPGLNLSDWAVFTADDVIVTHGFARLLALMRQANVVLLADERPIDIAVQGTTPLAGMAGITSDPQTDRLDTNVPTSQSAQAGSLNDVTSPVPQPQSVSTRTGVSLQSAQRVEIWVRALATPQAATIAASVDGRPVGSVTPVTLAGGGFEWLRLATVPLRAGRHQVVISAAPSIFGDAYEVAEARVLGVHALQATAAALARTLHAEAAKVAYSFNLASVAKWSWASLARSLGPSSPANVPNVSWTVPAAARSAVSATAGPDGLTVLRFVAVAGRAIYAVAEIRYRKAQDWIGRPYIYLPFKGVGSGRLYQFVFRFGPSPSDQAQYLVTDNIAGWRTLAFPTANPGPGHWAANWAHVISVRIALPLKSEPGSFAVGDPRPSGLVRSVTVALPILRGRNEPTVRLPRARCVDGRTAATERWLAARGELVLRVSSMNPSCTMFVPPHAGYRQLPALSVALRRTGIETWAYSFLAPQPGVLVWTQAYDPMWVLRRDGPPAQPVPVLSLVNGYLIGPGRHTGVIAFAGESSAYAGVAVTGLAVVLLAVVALVGRRRSRGAHRAEGAADELHHGRQSPVAARFAGALLAVCVVLLVACPAAAYAGWSAALVPVGSAALLAWAMAAAITHLAHGRPRAVVSESGARKVAGRHQLMG